MFSEIIKDMNWVAVFVGALAYFMLGALWYSLLFQKQWVAYQGITKEDMEKPGAKKGVGVIMFASFVLMFVNSFALSVLVNKMGVWGWMSGVKLGLFTGICFACVSIGINMLYEKKPLGLFFINGAYQVVGNIIAAVIIVLWQ